MRLIGAVTMVWLAFSVVLNAAEVFEIKGIVVDLNSGKPIHHAKVMLSGWNIAERHIAETLVALTDEEGKFRFADLPKTSEYRANTAKAGYAPSWRNQFNNLHTTSNIKMNLIRHVPTMVTVRDDAGFPVAGARVGFSGRPDGDSFDIDFFSLSDQDGFSRNDLPPGRYRMVVIAPGADTLFSARDLTFRPHYYPGTEDLSRADWIDLGSGKDFHADIRVAPIRAREIRVHLDFEGTINQVFVSSKVNENAHLVWGLVQWKDGARDVYITGLAPGKYLLVFNSQFIKSVDAQEEVTHVVVSSADRK